MRSEEFAWILLVGVFAASCTKPQVRRSDFETTVWGPDSVRAAWLKTNGQSQEGQRVTVWAPRTVSAARLEALKDSLDSGLVALDKLLADSKPWRRNEGRKITYYLSPDTFISHATGEAAVYISWFRIDRGQAPLKHEAAHELLTPKPPYWSEEYADSVAGAKIEENWPLWLTEGLPDYVAKRVASETGIREGDIFETGGPSEVDRVCSERRRGEMAGIVDRFLPGRGRPPELYTERRREVAPVFYACAHSFVKYLVDRFGLAAVIDLMRSKDALASLEKLSGESAAVMHADWQRRLTQ